VQRARAQMRSMSARGRVRRSLRWMVLEPPEVAEESLMEASSSVGLPLNPEILRKTTSVVWKRRDKYC
jgi:hypothetical protein